MRHLRWAVWFVIAAAVVVNLLPVDTTASLAKDASMVYAQTAVQPETDILDKRDTTSTDFRTSISTDNLGFTRVSKNHNLALRNKLCVIPFFARSSAVSYVPPNVQPGVCLSTKGPRAP